MKSKSSCSKFSKNARPVPNDLVGVLLCVPDDVNLGEIQWHDEMPGRLVKPRLSDLLRGALVRAAADLAREEWIAAETECALKLPPAALKAWMADMQKLHDAALLSRPWGWAA